jgi:hypothetical protein
MMITSEFPDDQPVRFTISWMMAEISGVRWSGPAAPALFQGGGDQLTEAFVVGRMEMLLLEDENVAA